MSKNINDLHGNCDYCKNKNYKGIPDKHCVIPEPCLPPNNKNWEYDDTKWFGDKLLSDMLNEELTEQEKIDREKDANDIEFTDWNKISLNRLVKYLEDKYKFDSSGEAHAIFRLIDFYKQNK